MKTPTSELTVPLPSQTTEEGSLPEIHRRSLIFKSDYQTESMQYRSYLDIAVIGNNAGRNPNLYINHPVR